LLTLRDLKQLNAASIQTIPDSLLAELARIDDALPEIQAPIYESQVEEQRVAKRCRESFLEFSIEVMRHEGLAPAAHHRLLIKHLQAVVDGQIQRLMIFMPPGSAKSKYTSELLPAWFMGHCPGEPVIGASHTNSLSRRLSGRAQRYLRAYSGILGCELASEAKERWETTLAGEYLSATVGGSLPGFRAQLCIIDDPVKGRDDADSENSRQKVWDWYVADVTPRLRPNAGIILMHTRWHEDDLAGRLLAVERGKWTVLKLPAIAEDPALSTPEHPIESDPLGRKPGEPLWNDDGYEYGRLMLRMRDDLAIQGKTREWQSQYQQNPRPSEGALFKTAKIGVMDVSPELRGAQICRGWDLAATRKIGTNDPDWTVGVKLARMPSGLFVVLDVERFRGDPDEVDQRIKNVADQDGVGVKISIPQDPGQAGKKQILAFTRLLSGHRIESSPETGDKATRASPCISQVNGGNFGIVAAPWNRAFLDELGAFPSGAKDDQVDALSRAFSIVGLEKRAMVVSDGALAFLSRR
jgi:predicted phage terminase large subunit-like protein